MPEIELICIGNQKFRSLSILEEAYEKKIRYFTKFNITEIKPFRSGDEKISMEKDGEKILKRAGKDDLLIPLDREGKELSSGEFSEFISREISRRKGKLIFAIGGAPGLSKRVLERSGKIISFSKMTFAHDLFRIVFLEQLYRAFTIIKGTGYHRE